MGGDYNHAVGGRASSGPEPVHSTVGPTASGDDWLEGVTLEEVSRQLVVHLLGHHDLPAPPCLHPNLCEVCSIPCLPSLKLIILCLMLRSCSFAWAFPCLLEFRL